MDEKNIENVENAENILQETTEENVKKEEYTIPPKTAEKKEHGRLFLHIRRVICYVVLVAICLLSVMPFIILLINATRNNSQIAGGFAFEIGKSFANNFKNAWDDKDGIILVSARNSLIVSSLFTLLSVYFSALTAYGIYAYDFKFKKIANAFILLIMMVPTQVTTLGFLDEIRAFGLIDSFIPLIVPGIAAPATYFFMIQYMKSALPMEIVEAARIDGGNEFYNFNKIVLPIMKPAMAVQAIFSFVNSWNNYFVPNLVLESESKWTLPKYIAFIRSADFAKFDLGQLYMTIALAIIPMIIIYLMLSKFIIRGVALGGVKG